MDYAGFCASGRTIHGVKFVLNHCLRSEGSAAFAMIGIAVGAILNIVLDPIFILSLIWGVKGASIATAISKIVSFVILLTPYLRRHSLLYLSVRNIRYSREIISEVVKMGLPATLRSTLLLSHDRPEPDGRCLFRFGSGGYVGCQPDHHVSHSGHPGFRPRISAGSRI